MKIKDTKIALAGIDGPVRIKRMQGGFPRIEADAEIDLHYGLGYIHAHDRQTQMWLMKVIGYGKASELLSGDEELIEIDKFMRWINLCGDAADEVQKLSDEAMQILKAYCRGVNDALADTGRPFEFKLMGYQPDPWTPVDILLIAKMIGYIGLTQSQGDAEKFILELIRNDVDPQKIKELFPYIKEDMPADFIDIVKQVKLIRPIVSESLAWIQHLPGAAASNNWAIGPEKSASGKAMLCGDPHLALQMPSIWYSALMISGAYYMMGAGLAGVPSIVLGRTRHLAWAVTYGTMDMIDYFIEEVKNKKYRRGEKWLPFEIREETIRPRKKDPITIKVYKNETGLLEGEPEEDGYYLNYAWSSRKGRLAESINNLLKVPHAKSTEEAMQYFARLPFAPFNWVAADDQGNIGYQLGGLYPQKAPDTSGLLPYPGWDESQAWQGMIDASKYPRKYNPEQGFIATANQNLNSLGEVAPMTLPMSSYRADRIEELLDQGESFSVDDMKKMHYDLYSRQAAAFMEIIQPLLPQGENSEILKNWDCRYNVSSLGATLFENIYMELLKRVFGENGMGVAVMEHVIKESPMFAMLHGNFDRVLLNEESVWFGDRTRQEIYQTAIERGLKKPCVPYGKTTTMYFPHILFGQKLPKIFGFDFGPYELIGSRATIPQGQQYKVGGRPASFAPTFRMIADLATEEMHTNIAGGPSDRRFSKYYTMGMQNWIEGGYDVFKP
ncbi:MAG: penicillin acylase family protein [Deltaproteobacteria bacterium]|jgi:penicillin amidase|nr:penicillin acylase family protein [Deltaproteobacteria bacterium]